MMNELKESWDAHVNSTRNQTTETKLDVRTLEMIQNDAVHLRQKVEDFVLNALNQVSDQNAHWHENAHSILRLQG